MNHSHATKTKIHIAVVESDPLRFVGFRALLSAEADFDVQSVTLAEIDARQPDIVLLGSHSGRNAVDVLCTLKALRPDLDVIVTGLNLDDDVMLQAIAAGAKGFVDETAPVSELARAIRHVRTGSVWAPRRILFMFVEQAYRFSGHGVALGQRSFTVREKEVLKMLVAGCSNKEIARPLGIEERTVKAHVAKLMRKVGVSNRISLSVHAITHALLPSVDC